MYTFISASAPSRQSKVKGQFSQMYSTIPELNRNPPQADRFEFVGFRQLTQRADPRQTPPDDDESVHILFKLDVFEKSEERRLKEILTLGRT